LALELDFLAEPNFDAVDLPADAFFAAEEPFFSWCDMCPSLLPLG